MKIMEEIDQVEKIYPSAFKALIVIGFFVGALTIGVLASWLG